MARQEWGKICVAVSNALAEYGMREDEEYENEEYEATEYMEIISRGPNDEGFETTADAENFIRKDAQARILEEDCDPPTYIIVRLVKTVRAIPVVTTTIRLED